MKKTSRIRLASRPLIFTSLMIALLSAGLSLRGDGPLRDNVAAQTSVAVVNAASFATDRVVSTDSIAAAFGQFVTQNNQSFFAQAQPLPVTLGGVSVKIGNTDAGLFFVGTTQINFAVPPGLADNPAATITVTNSDNTTRTGTFSIVRAAPGVFTVNSGGTGLAVAQTTPDGITFQNIYNPDLSPRDVDVGTTERPNFLVIYMTGVRNTPNAVTVKFQGVPGRVTFAGPVAGLTSFDQVNVVLPPECAGLGIINVVVNVNGRDANRVTMKLGGQIPPVRVTSITPGMAVNGELTAMDQVQRNDSTGDTFFFDAYDFTTTAPNTSIAVDLRSTQFDAGVLLYRVDVDRLTFLGADDQSGSYGAPTGVINNDSLLLTVLPDVARYVIFATSSDFQPNGVGQYALRLSTNVITPIAYSQTTSGAAISNTDIQTSGGTFLDAYWFNGAQGDRQDIVMRSTAFDSFLILQGNEGDPPFTADDNSFGPSPNRDARISPTTGDIRDFPPIPSLPRTGIYIIIATPLDASVTAGAYTLSLNRLSGFGVESESAVNFSAPGRLIGSQSRVAESGGTTFERFGRRRIIQE
jgi:uncharacterized protein (TIGR03437 family)